MTVLHSVQHQVDYVCKQVCISKQIPAQALNGSGTVVNNGLYTQRVPCMCSTDNEDIVQGHGSIVLWFYGSTVFKN